MPQITIWKFGHPFVYNFFFNLEILMIRIVLRGNYVMIVGFEYSSTTLFNDTWS